MITNLKDQLVRDEGLKLKPYRDSVGKITIGIGRNLTDGGISLDEASSLCDHDIAIATEALAETFPWTKDLDDCRRKVLVNMCFNLGIAKLAQFRDFLAKLEARDYAGAAKAMLESRWATQVGDRADRLSKQIETGAWQ
jgi:lysozyme